MLSLPHLVILFIIALLVFGPEKLPELARMLGKAMAEFRRITYDVRKVVEDEMRDMEHQAREADLRKREAALAAEREKEKATLPAGSTMPSAEESVSIQPPAGTIHTDPPTSVKADPEATIAKPESQVPENTTDPENTSDADSSPS